MGVRKGSPFEQTLKLLPRFLLTGLQSLYRSKRLLDIGCKKEIQTCSKEISFHESTIDKRKNIQEMPIDFQRLNPVRVIDIEISDYNGYVYNLEVEDSHTYFVNSILTHNCACYWTLIEDDRRFTSEMIYEDIPIESIKQLDPDNKILPKASAGLALQLAGAGLLVGGAFLLARSNLWNTFFTTVFNRPLKFPIGDIEDVFEEVLEYIDIEFSPDIKKAVVDTARDIGDGKPQVNVRPAPIL